MCAWFRVKVQMWISRVAIKEQLYDIASSPSCGFSVTLRIDGRSNQRGEPPVWGPKTTLSMASIRSKDNQTSENSLESEGMSFIVAIECAMRSSSRAGVSWTPVAMMVSYGYTGNSKSTTKYQHSIPANHPDSTEHETAATKAENGLKRRQEVRQKRRRRGRQENNKRQNKNKTRSQTLGRQIWWEST